jgi:hypothetical protein
LLIARKADRGIRLLDESFAANDQVDTLGDREVSTIIEETILILSAIGVMMLCWIPKNQSLLLNANPSALPLFLPTASGKTFSITTLNL